MRWRAKYGNQEANEYENNSDEELFHCFKLPSGNDASRSDDQALELFLELVENDIFHPDLAKTKYRSISVLMKEKNYIHGKLTKTLQLESKTKGHIL